MFDSKWVSILGSTQGRELRYVVAVIPEFIDLDQTKLPWGIPVEGSFKTMEEAEEFAVDVHNFLTEVERILYEDFKVGMATSTKLCGTCIDQTH